MESEDQNKPQSDQEKADPPVSGVADSVPPVESDSLPPAPKQNISGDKEDQRTENPPLLVTPTPPVQRKEILVIPTVPVPKVLCVPFNASDDEINS